MFQRRSLLLAVILATTLAYVGSSLADDAILPRPAPDAIAKAKERIRDVYQSDLAGAGKPEEKLIQ